MIAPDEPLPPDIANHDVFVPPLPPIAERISLRDWMRAWLSAELVSIMVGGSSITGLLLNDDDTWNLTWPRCLGITGIFLIAATLQFFAMRRFVQRLTWPRWVLAIGGGYWLIIGFWWLYSHERLPHIQPEMLRIALVSLMMAFLHGTPASIALLGLLPRPWLWALAHLLGALVVTTVTILCYLVDPDVAVGIYLAGILLVYPILTAWIFHSGMRRTYATEG